MNTPLIGHKRYIIVLIAILLSILTACPGASDWIFSNLPNNYEIWRINSQDIVFGQTEGESFNRLISRYVLAFCYNNRYIGLQRYPMDSLPYDTIVDIENLDTSNPEYYLVDSEQGTIYGPYTEDAYLCKISELGITEMCDWISTNPKPDGAV